MIIQFIKPDPIPTRQVLNLFGRESDSSQQKYRNFVSEGMKLEAIWSKLKEQTQPTRMEKKSVLSTISVVYNVKKKDVIARKHSEAYQTAAWLLRRVVNLSLKETADLFGVSSSRISHIQKAIESTERTKKQCEAERLCKVKQ